MRASKFTSLITILYFIVSIQFTIGRWMEPINYELHHDPIARRLPRHAAFYRHNLDDNHHHNLQRVPLPPIDPNGPCALYNPPVPDFRAPGRRISEVKCYEFIHQMKKRHDLQKRKEECNKIMRVPSIIGGHTTDLGEYPNMGAIGWKAVTGTWKFMCGSSLISSKFVLTAAHCSYTADTTIADAVPKIVRLGDRIILDRSEQGIAPYDKRIVKITVHPNFKSPKKYFDIALMELDSEVMFSRNLQPACLWTKHNTDIAGLKANVTGWGVVQSGSHQSSPKLLAAEVDIINSTTCDNLLKRFGSKRIWFGLEEHEFCAGKLSGDVDTCEGDSGGPLQVKIQVPLDTEGNLNYVLGVISFGKGCAQPDLPGVYVRVSSFIDWIESIVWPGE